MSQSACSEISSVSRSRGDMLTEAIISMLLIGIAGMGITYVVSSVSNSQRDFKVQQQVVNELRSKIQNRASRDDLCTAGPGNTANFDVAVTRVSGCDPVQATVSGAGITTKTIDGVYSPMILTAAPSGIGTVRVGGAENEQVAN